MSTHWSVFFYETLAEYVQLYIEARGDRVARALLLQGCQAEITKSPLHENQVIKLPEHLCWAIRKEFLPYLDDDDSKEEEAKLRRLEEGEEELTPEQREAVGKPADAGEYWNEFNVFRAATHLFADEVALVDNESRDKTDKTTIGNRTGAVRKWFRELPSSKLEEAKRAAEKWNLEGATNKVKMDTYRKKNLVKNATKFINSLHRTMGVHCVFLLGYETLSGKSKVKTAYVESAADEKRGCNFTQSSSDRRDWVLQGGALLDEYLTEKDNALESPSDREDKDEVPEIMVDDSGHPILPARLPDHLKSQQDVVRGVFTKAYMKITNRSKIHVPWLELARMPSKYLDINTIPTDLEVLDPSRLTKPMIFLLWVHWSVRQRAGLPILVFTAARRQDIRQDLAYLHARQEKPPAVKNNIPYVSFWSDDQASEDGPDGDQPNGHIGKGNDARADELEGPSGSSVRQLPSKRSHLSEQATLPEEQSPAANNSNRTEFLRSLSFDPSYKALLSHVLALPVLASSQSSSLASGPVLSLPSWMSWDYDKKYLPEDIHTRWRQFTWVLDLLCKSTFVNRDEGTSVVLGLGLLLRECWRAVEVEDDDENAPIFLRQSLLGKKRAEKVGEAIKKVIGMLPSPDADGKGKRPNKELDGSAKGQRARASQKRKRDNSPVRNARSQRQRKPSKKLRDSD